ncbi:MAG: hypothetical protein HRT90_10180, partial [Candidatus Margulisbacteria bacterium]|nr:hypothetical protein [Candidatus Margulisiibacteriota bacterium]
TYWAKKLTRAQLFQQLPGEDNYFQCIPRTRIVLRLFGGEHAIDIFRVCAAACILGIRLNISYAKNNDILRILESCQNLSNLKIKKEDQATFSNHLYKGKYQRIRLLKPNPDFIIDTNMDTQILVIQDPVLSNGRIELLHYLKEITISRITHRYGQYHKGKDYLK